MEDTKLRVFNIQHFSLHDGPGIRTTVFLKGCPLRCAWCCNPESQSSDAQWMGEAQVGKHMSITEIIEEVRQDEIFYRGGTGGITVSGGEPLAQGYEVAMLLKRAQEEYLTTAMETSGFAEREVILECANYLDTLYFDIKHLSEAAHKKWTGVSNEKILSNLKAVRNIYPNLNIIVRTPIIPGVNDQEELVAEIANFVKTLGISKYELLPYHPYGNSKYEKLGIKNPMKKCELDQSHFDYLKEVAKEVMAR